MTAAQAKTTVKIKEDVMIFVQETLKGDSENN